MNLAAELSKGTEDDLVIVPNIPLLGAMQKLKPQGSMAAAVFKSILRYLLILPRISLNLHSLIYKMF